MPPKWIPSPQWRKPAGVKFDRDYEREIMRTAFRARRADDPETAWFVAHFARDRLRQAWLNVNSIVFSLGAVVWMIVRGPTTLWALIVFVLVVILNAWSLFAYRRALRLNGPIGTIPPGLDVSG